MTAEQRPLLFSTMEMIRIIHPDRPESGTAVVSSVAFERIWEGQGYVRYETPLMQATRELEEDEPTVDLETNKGTSRKKKQED